MLSAARAAIDHIPDVRHDKIDALQSSVNDGTYHVDSEVVAKRMVDESLRESARFVGKNERRPAREDGDEHFD